MIQLKPRWSHRVYLPGSRLATRMDVIKVIGYGSFAAGDAEVLTTLECNVKDAETLRARGASIEELGHAALAAQLERGELAWTHAVLVSSTEYRTVDSLIALLGDNKFAVRGWLFADPMNQVTMIHCMEVDALTLVQAGATHAPVELENTLTARRTYVDGP